MTTLAGSISCTSTEVTRSTGDWPIRPVSSDKWKCTRTSHRTITGSNVITSVKQLFFDLFVVLFFPVNSRPLVEDHLKKCQRFLLILVHPINRKITFLMRKFQPIFLNIFHENTSQKCTICVYSSGEHFDRWPFVFRCYSNQSLTMSTL